MADKLKIYACSGVNGEEQQIAPRYYVEGNTVSNTQAVNCLLADLNARFIEATRLRTISQDQKIDALNDCDMLSVCLYAARHCADSEEHLRRAGEVIGFMCANGYFEYRETNSDKRQDNLDSLIARFNETYRDGDPVEQNPEFNAWWAEYVMPKNKVGLTFDKQMSVRKVIKAETPKILEKSKAVKGVGATYVQTWEGDKDLAEYLTNGGSYFLYTYLTDAQLSRLPGVFKLKKQKQLQTYNYCKKLFVDVYGDEEAMREIIRTGIIAEFEREPEDVAADIASGKKVKGVGITIEAIISLITVLAPIISGIIAAICSCVAKTNEAKYGSLDEQIVKSSVPQSDDFEEIDYTSQAGLGDGSKWVVPAIIGAGLLLILKHKKR